MSATARSLANRGAAFEERLAYQHARYLADGHFVGRNGPPMQFIPVKGGGVRAVPVKGAKGLPDYLVVAHGLAFLVDAKEHKGDRLPYGALPDYQAREMDRWVKQGPAFRAGLVVCLGGEVWFLPWTIGAAFAYWNWYNTPRARPGEGSWSVDDLDTCGRRVVGVDWLAVAP